MSKRVLYVGFSRPQKFKIGSLLIRWAESPKTWKSPRSWFSLYPASHVFAIFPAHKERPFYMVNEAAGAMIRWLSQPHFEDHSEILSLYRIEFPVGIFKEIKTYSDFHAGAPYALLENVGIVVVRLVKLFSGKTISNPLGKGDGVQKCSELMIRNVISRILDINKIADDLLSDSGYLLPADIDVIGVYDIAQVLKYLAKCKLCQDVAVITRLNVEAFEDAA